MSEIVMADIVRQMREVAERQTGQLVKRVRVTTDAFRHSAAVITMSPERARSDGYELGARELVIHPDDWRAAKRMIPVMGIEVVALDAVGRDRMLGLPVVIDDEPQRRPR